jgi:hypothetical protein
MMVEFLKQVHLQKVGGAGFAVVVSGGEEEGQRVSTVRTVCYCEGEYPEEEEEKL